MYHDKVAQLSKALYDHLLAREQSLSDRERVRVYCVYQIVCDLARRIEAFSSNPTTEAHNQLSVACFDPLSNLFEGIDSTGVATFENAAATAILA